MSQAKVDKRKYEKKNRKEIEKQRKAKFAMKCIIAALVIGAVVGVPLGIQIYRNMPKYVGDSTVSSLVNQYIDDKHSAELSVFDNKATTEESSEK